MPRVVQSRCGGHVLELPLAVVLEQHVAAAHGGDVEIGVAVVVDVGERRRHADLAVHRNARRSRDVLELAAAEIPDELIAAHLAQKVDVGQAVTVDVCDRESIAVVVMRRLVCLARVVHDAVLEGDAALLHPIAELEIVKRGDAGDGLDLRSLERLKPRVVTQIVGDVANRRRRRLRHSYGGWGFELESQTP